ncbi:SLAC1 anion channel family protein [Helicobacter burdigaliensis]|uniref:SLAC1 anion channel family protein n=1 Tax=Helicobacter burdigaliensis TaxID=2315334 RepID=UPI001E47E1E0|nr:SLAC1 anion channel family protein [Helicobacter burdigaliensis]
MNETLKKSWLSLFPIMFFASVMGIGGLSLLTHKAIKVFSLSGLDLVANLLTFFSIFLLLFVLILYLAKIFLYPKAFLKELSHPVRINFFAAVSVSVLIIQMLSLKLFPLSASIALFYLGAILQIIFSLYVVQYWFINAMDQKMASPAWFIPIVGNLIVPLAGANLNAIAPIIPFEFLVFYLGMGSFFWIILNAALLFRLIFGENLPQKFTPTLFIFIAPPSIFGLDILLLFKPFLEAQTLYFIASFSFSIAIFFFLLMLVMLRIFTKLKFALSWWAFTFPLAAFSLCALELYSIHHSLVYSTFGIFGIILTIFAVVIVGIRTLIAIKNKEICVIEE